MSSVLRYPLKAPMPGNQYLESTEGPTGRVDYLRFQRFRLQYKDGQYGGLNLPDNATQVQLNKTIAYVSMPQNLTAAYMPNYAQVGQGILGIAGAKVAGAVEAGLSGDQLNDLLTETLQSTAGAAIPELLYNKGAGVLQSLNNMGSLGGSVSGNNLMALGTGKIMNPYTEQIFQGISFRNHSFSQKMLARNKKEAREIVKLIEYFKTGALPILEGGKYKKKKGGNNSSGGNNIFTSKKTVAGRFLKIPDYFLLEFVRVNPETDTIAPIPHYKFQPCVCTGVNVNYTPDGQYVSFKDAIADLREDGDGGLKQMMVPAVEISLQFAETRILTQQDAEAGF